MSCTSACLVIFHGHKEGTKCETFSVSQCVLCLHSCSQDRKLGLGSFQEVIMKQTFSGHHENDLKKKKAERKYLAHFWEIDLKS